MGTFITTEPLGSPGERGEYRVWERVQDGFSDRNCLAYWRYPIFSPMGKARKEPDILICDRHLGVIIIEVKSLRIEQIKRISGHRWYYDKFYQKTGNPYQQAEAHLWAILDYCDREPLLENKITARALVALPNITKEQWQAKRFSQNISSPPILFENNLRPSAIQQLVSTLETIPTLKSAEPLADLEWENLLSLISGTPLFQANPSSRWRLYSSPSRAEILRQARDRYSELDLHQEQLAKTIPPGMQRIRGIAGSGKTAILCQKAAHMHLKHPDWTIAIVFCSRHLHQQISEQLDRWLRHFSCDRISYHPNNRKLRVFHGWGSKEQPGFYRYLCRISGVSPRTVQDTLSHAPHEAFAEVCLDLLRRGKIPQVFDAILIDEGQDFLVKDRLKFEGKQPLYWLAYQSLKSVSSLHPEQRRLIWTMDEHQHLHPVDKYPTRDLLGSELSHVLNGEHPGGISKSEILSLSYRTPAEIVLAAYGLGMGIYRAEGMLTQLQDISDWQALGFAVEGKPISGETIILTRPGDSQLNAIAQLWDRSCLQFETYESRREELAQLSANIIRNLRHDGLKPSRDILVLLLGSYIDTRQLEPTVIQALIGQGIDVHLPGRKGSRSFWSEAAVTVCNVEKAKGNEADMVYAIALDGIARDESNLSLRNQLFTAFTRTRGWLTVSGVGQYSLYNELRQIKQNPNTLTFTYLNSAKRSLTVTNSSELLQRYAAGERNFQNLNLNDAQLPGVDLRHSNLIRTQLQRANLENAQLQGAKLIMADLSEANLKGANLREAKLIGANLKNTQLDGADLTHADLPDIVDLNNM